MFIATKGNENVKFCFRFPLTLIVDVEILQYTDTCKDTKKFIINEQKCYTDD